MTGIFLTSVQRAASSVNKMGLLHNFYARAKPWVAARFYYALSPISPVLTSRILYWRKFKYSLNLHSPQTLNEKLMWLKLYEYGQSPLVSQCADKLRVRDYVSAAGWGNILNELYGAWDSASQIPWNQLPDSFVLKCNHGCGFNVICPDKHVLDITRSRARLDQWMRTDFWRFYAELQYRSIPKRIVCERYLGGQGRLPEDYKVYCFHGVPQYILVCEGRSAGKPRFYFFDTGWHFCPLTRDGLSEPEDFTLERPVCLPEMLKCAAELSAPFPFVRADFYVAEGRLVFGELTFTPSGALDTDRLPETDRLLGSFLTIPVAAKNETRQR